jgi:hypothetical protein
MTKRKTATIDDFEGKSDELLHIAFSMCEAGLKGVDRCGPELSRKALAAAAESLRESARTFAAVAKVCGKPKG